MRVGRRMFVLVASVGGLAALAVSAVASSQTAPSFALPEAGLLRLHLGSADYFRFEPAAGGSALQEITTVRQCEVQLGGPQLAVLRATPSSSAVGIASDGLGVRSKGPGQNCGQVEATETLELTLGAAPALSGLKIGKADLDIEGKFNAVVVAEMYLGNTPVGTRTLSTGERSDSGPDSGDGDNYRFLLEASSPFDRIVLKLDSSTPGGAFSLEGGADGTSGNSLANTADSVFQLVEFDGLLDCEETVMEGGAGTPAAELFRGTNAGCERIPYLLRTAQSPDGQSVDLFKDLAEQEGANFRMRITWQPEATAVPVSATEIDLDGPEGPADPTPVVACEGTTQNPQLPDTDEPWCLAAQSMTLVGGGMMQVSEEYFGSGDPTWTRR